MQSQRCSPSVRSGAALAHCGSAYWQRSRNAQPQCASAVPLRADGEHRWLCIHEDLPQMAR